MEARVRADDHGKVIHRITEGRIAETWNNYDAAGMLRQLGAISGIKSEG